MRIKASVLTPVLAMVTIMALIGTGIALGQSGHGDASATLLDSTPDFALAATPDAVAGVQTRAPSPALVSGFAPSASEDIGHESDHPSEDEDESHDD